jgi:hypothetical protein
MINDAVYSQSKADTVELIKDFSKVMSFAAKPYLYCTMITKMTAEPILDQQDTVTTKGVMYKNGTDFYFNNGLEETYLQDSLMIQINHKRKSIWLSKVDVASKEKMNVLPINNKQLQELIRKKYSIYKSVVDENIVRLNFETNQKKDSITSVTTNVGLEYFTKSYLPRLMEIKIRMQQPLSEDLLAALKNENISDSKLIQVIDEIKYLVRTQIVIVEFYDISDEKEQAAKMPSWKAILDYQVAGNEFIPKGTYTEFEVTKTF